MRFPGKHLNKKTQEVKGAAEFLPENNMGYKNLVFDKDSVFLVTGGAGFIGSNLCEAILEMGYKVRCLDDLSTGNPKHVEMFADNAPYIPFPGLLHTDWIR